MGRYTKERLFEMMNKVGGMSIVKEENSFNSADMPPGISPDNFISLEQYAEEVPCSTGVNEDNPLDFGAKMQPVDDIRKLLRKKDTEIHNKKQNYNTGGRIHGGTLNDIRNNKDFDIDKLKNILSQKPNTKQFLSQNGKMGKSNFYNVTLPAFKGLLYNQSDDKFYVVNVCDKASECVRDCYAQMGRYIIFDATVRLNTQKLNYLMNHWNEWKSRMVATITAMSWGGGSVIRWHDSGDFISDKYLDMAFEIAKLTPKDFHYAYTKEISLVQSKEVPDNFEIKFSFGGKEDNLIDSNAQGHSRIIPDELFKDLQPKETGRNWDFSPEAIEKLKDRISKKYSVDRNILLTNKEIMEIPYDEKGKHERKWIVINWSGNNDIPALRKDVLAVYNLKHR